MVFRKAIIQVYSGNEPFGFDDFVRGTLRLFNYAIDHSIDVKINISGSEFEPYMIVNNYNYDKTLVTPKTYYMNVDQESLIKDLDAFMNTSDAVYVLTSNVWFDRVDIYNLSYVGFDKLVRYRETLYQAAEQRVRENLLYRPHSDNLLYGYSVIYLNRHELEYTVTARQLASLANQMRGTLDMNKDMILFSNSIQLRRILAQYIQMNSSSVQKIDDSDMDIGPLSSIPTIEDLLIDFIVLLKAKKIYRFTDGDMRTGHNIRFTESYRLKQEGLITKPFTNVYEAAFDINNIIGNLEITLFPLYYKTYTLVNTLLNSPSGITVDTSGNLYFSDTMNHCIRRLDTLGNFTLYAGTPGSSGYQNGHPMVAMFNRPSAVAMDRSGNLYVADTLNDTIRIIERNYVYDPSGNVIAIQGIANTLVGNGPSVSPDTVAAGTGTGALLQNPMGVAVDSDGHVYVSDTGNNRICKVVSGGILETIAGAASLAGPLIYRTGFINGTGTEASFNGPTGLCVDLKGNIFVADTQNNAIRRITPSGKVSTVAGNGQPFYKEGRNIQAGLGFPTGVCVDLNNVLYVTDTSNNVIRRITNDGAVLLVVGSPNQKTGNIDGYGATDPKRAPVPFSNRATMNKPSAICVGREGNLFVADTLNHRIRKIVPTFSTPTDIKPVAMQALRIIHAPGVAYNLGPTLSAPPPPPNTIVYGHRRGSRR